MVETNEQLKVKVYGLMYLVQSVTRLTLHNYLLVAGLIHVTSHLNFSGEYTCRSTAIMVTELIIHVRTRWHTSLLCHSSKELRIFYLSSLVAGAQWDLLLGPEVARVWVKCFPRGTTLQYKPRKPATRTLWLHIIEACQSSLQQDLRPTGMFSMGTWWGPRW